MTSVRGLPCPLSTIAISTLLVVALGAGTVLADPATEEGKSLRSVVELAMRANPEVRRARVEVEAAELARRGASAPTSNPAISVEGGPRFGADGPQADIGVSLEIPFDLGGTSRRRRVAGVADLDAARARLAGVELQVATRARVLFAEAVAADARLRLAEDAVALAEEMERVARRRHELGEVSILEPNFAGLERADAQGALLDARVERSQAYRALRALLALPVDAPLSLTPGPEPTESAPLTLQGLLAQASEHPELAAADHASRTAAADLAVSRGDGAPGLSASAGWSREGDEANLVTGGLRIELPLQRNQLGVAEARRAAGVAEIDAEAAGLAVPRDLAAALDGWVAAAARFTLATTDALPLAEQNLELVLRAYEAGKEELLAVLLLQRQALAARGAAIDAELELHRAAAALERAVGQEVF